MGAFFVFLVEEGEVSFYEKPTTLLFVGDIMLSRQIGAIIEREQDPLFHTLRIKDAVSEADIAFANFENPASDRGINQGSIYSFRAKPDLVRSLSFAGFDIVSVANNHMFDWGSDAFSDTLKHLNEYGVFPVGGGSDYSAAHSPVRIEKHGEVFCFLAYSQFASEYVSGKNAKPAMAKLALLAVVEDITKAKNSNCPTVIISLHWGNEYETSPTLAQKEIAHALVDAGAHLIIGHHPHVVQPVEEYREGLIAYSLGNFIFDQNFSEDTRKGLLLRVVMHKGTIVSYDTEEVHFTDSFQPYLGSLVE